MTDFVKVPDIRVRGFKMPKCGGIYKWWCTKKQFDSFLQQLKIHNSFVLDMQYVEMKQVGGEKYYCFYVGKAGKNLRDRIKGLHIGTRWKKNPFLGKAIVGSTLRRSINALKNGSQTFNENDVDEILDTCLVQWEEVEPENIDKREKEEINKFVRILNRDDLDELPNKCQQEQREEISKALKLARTGKN